MYMEEKGLLITTSILSGLGFIYIDNLKQKYFFLQNNPYTQLNPNHKKYFNSSFYYYWCISNL